MKHSELLNYAYHGALAMWASEHTKLENNPTNRITQYWEKIRYEDLQEIERMMSEESKTPEEIEQHRHDIWKDCIGSTDTAFWDEIEQQEQIYD